MTAKRAGLPFHIVDAFAVEPLTGNPLAVVDGGVGLTLDLFRRIAREFNQSETTFVLPPTRPKADWRLRSFTAAGVEVFGAGGHNSLGAWWWLAEAGRLALNGRSTVFHQEIGERVLPVTISQTGDTLAHVVTWMGQEIKGAAETSWRLAQQAKAFVRHREVTHEIRGATAPLKARQSTLRRDQHNIASEQKALHRSVAQGVYPRLKAGEVYDRSVAQPSIRTARALVVPSSRESMKAIAVHYRLEQA